MLLYFQIYLCFNSAVFKIPVCCLLVVWLLIFSYWSLARQNMVVPGPHHCLLLKHLLIQRTFQNNFLHVCIWGVAVLMVIWQYSVFISRFPPLQDPFPIVTFPWAQLQNVRSLAVIMSPIHGTQKEEEILLPCLTHGRHYTASPGWGRSLTSSSSASVYLCISLPVQLLLPPPPLFIDL